MGRKVFSKADLPAWIEELGQNHRLVAPHPVGEEYTFSEAQDVAQVTLDYPTTILPPKKELLPPHEVLFSFNTRQARVEPVLEERSTVLLGVHSCDMHALTLLDEAYGRDYPDQHYLKRRAGLVLISIECLQPCSSDSFCRDMNTQSVPDNYDLHLTDLGELYTVDIGTPTGRHLLDNLPSLRAPTLPEQELYRRLLSRKWSRFTYRLQADVVELPGLFSLSYKSGLWEEIGARCLSCGACSLVCPTCFCFEVQDEIDLALVQGERFRRWDSCQLNGFARVAGGHDFRATRAGRLRHRFFHKHKYQADLTGRDGCVGCGRCAQTCPVKIAPIEVLNKLYRQRALPHGAVRRG